MKSLIIDTQPGISGDMFLAASIGLGCKVDKINDLLAKFKYKTRIKIKKIHSGHFKVNKLIIFDENLKHLELVEIVEIIRKSKLSETAETIALKIVENLIEVEKKIHNTHHLHSDEIASVDTLIDAVGAGLMIDDLGVKNCFITSINIPRFYKKGRKYPSFAPATLEILKGFKLRYIDIDEEIITPTGASIIKTLSNPRHLMSEFTAIKTSYATGNKQLKVGPNLLRLILADVDLNLRDEEIYLIETAVDDETPEVLSYLQEKLFKSGALDVYIHSHYGKKNRIGFTVKVLSDKNNLECLLDAIFKETTTNGIRYQKINRRKLFQEMKYINIKYGKVRIKISNIKGVSKIKPEYEDCKLLALKFKIPLKVILEEVKLKIPNLELKKK
ncbi:MAG: LarC family nickel insertion protein [Candidatus Saelkia tenebricola]|nr:LarC family nickel insertion protein [Candidatus Saelkia tenebricola]